MSDTRFHIIVPTFRRPDDLSVLLDLLMPQLDDAPDARLTVVNDGSHSRAYQKVIAAWGDRLAYIPLDDNTGIIGARLAGISQTTEDYIVFTDDDCRPGPHWVAKVRAAVTAYPNADIIAGRTEIVQDRPRWHDSLWHDLPNATPGPVAPFGVLATAVTANAIFRRWVFDGVTAPDIRMRHFPDDYYLTQMALKAGASFVLMPGLVTGHVSRGGPIPFLRQQSRYGRAAARYAIWAQDALMASMMSHPPLGGLRQGIIDGRAAGRSKGAQVMEGLSRFMLLLGWHYGVWRDASAAGIDRKEIATWRLRFAETVTASPD